MPNDDATPTNSGKKSSSGTSTPTTSASPAAATEKPEKSSSNGESKKKSSDKSSSNGGGGGGGGGGEKKSRKEKKEAKASRRNKVSDKVAAQVEELERDGVGEGELVFNSTPGVKVTRDDFELMTLIGRGSFGKVMQVRQRDTQQIYAMKVLRKEAIIARKQVTHTQAEKAILAKIQHPFIVKLHYAFQTKEKLYMILDYINGGELFFHLKREGRFPEERVRFYAAEIISAISHLHSLDIVYRDLKPENILLDREGHVVITDFGLSKEIDQDEGTHTFCVPEDHELLTNRGFMNLDAYRAASARDDGLLVAGYDARAKSLLFEAPHRLVEYASATRTLVELESDASGAGVSMLVTRDHDLVAQLGECAARNNQFVPRRHAATAAIVDFEKIKASELLAGKCGAVRQLAAAEAGVGARPDAPLIAELGLVESDKIERFYELYGLFVGGGALVCQRRALRFDRLDADARQWLCDTLALLNIDNNSNSDDAAAVYIVDEAWVRALADDKSAAAAASERSLASWVWQLGTTALRAVLRGLARADGASSVVVTSSAQLRDELVRVALMAGCSAHFVVRCASNGAGSGALSWAVSFADATAASAAPVLQVARGEVREREYTGRVWCFTMPSGHVWVRRVNAKSGAASRAILTGNCGTPEYLAPEVLKGQGHGMGVDWWSLGTLLFEMMTGLPPFFSQNINIMYQKILNGELKFPSHMSPEAQSLLSGFLTRDPEQRLGSRETGGEIKIKQHPWFAVFDWDKLDRKQIPPPWVPEVSDELDVGQIDSTFTAEAPTDSPENDSPIAGAGKDANFSGFTFQPDSVLEN